MQLSFLQNIQKKLIWVFFDSTNKSEKALFLCGTKFKLTNNLKRATYGISFEISWLFPFFLKTRVLFLIGELISMYRCKFP